MARKALQVKAAKRKKKYLADIAAGRTPEFAVRVYNRCQITGRRHGYMRFFGMSRIMFRKLASQGMIPGVTKSSW